MGRLAPKSETVRALFARSGNQCAFPGCTQPIVNKKNKFIGQICHIESAMPGGERFNSLQTDEDRRDYKNLILFCYPHHIETDDVYEYTVETLINIKYEHESLFEKSDFKIDEAELNILMNNMEKYWGNIEQLNNIDHAFKELAFEVNASDGFLDILYNLYKTIDFIEQRFKRLNISDNKLMEDFYSLLTRKGIDNSIFSDIPYYENPFENRNWESHNIGTPNNLKRLRIDLAHIEVKYLEEYLKTNSQDQKSKVRLEEVKSTFAKLAQTAIMID